MPLASPELEQYVQQALRTGAPVHASAVAVDGAALLICGRAGTGKSSLALAMMALGAQLIADDRTLLSQKEGLPWLACPASTTGLIEARGVGILRCPAISGARLAAVVDLAREETERLPPLRNFILMGHSVPLLLNVRAPHFAQALMLCLRHGRHGE